MMIRKIIDRPPRAVWAASLLAAVFFTLQALWIPAKAALGQVLVERAWHQVLAGRTDARPWPWADTSPVGILEIPRLGVRQFVLSGTSGRNLAWGPVAASAGGPIGLDDTVLSGHRDTHFAGLNALRAGDRILLTTPDRRLSFEISQMEIVDSTRQDLLLEPGVPRLTLVTCYPFNALRATSPLRYVVTALPSAADLPRPSAAARQTAVL